MSFLYALALVGGILILIFLNVVKQRANMELYRKLHPPKKCQEEFLKACELFLAYCKAPEAHRAPAMEAKRDAALAIQEQGFLPACLEHLGRPKDRQARLALLAADREPSYITYQAIQRVSQAAFISCRAQDRSLTGYSQDQRFWDNGTFLPEKWDAYCHEMDLAFNRMVARYETELPDQSSAEPGPVIDLTDPA